MACFGASVPNEAEELGATGSRSRVVAEQCNEAVGGAFDRCDPMQAVSPGEEHECPWRHRYRGDVLGTAAVEGRRHVGVVLVVGGPEHRHAFEVSAALARLQCNRHHEVGLVEVPRQLVVVPHDRNVHGAERIVVAKQLPCAERECDEIEQCVPLVEGAQR